MLVKHSLHLMGPFLKQVKKKFTICEMRSIKRLPESVHSSVRSGVVIRDFATIVEELIFNSLEAGATKVYVAVGVGSCYVKVVDNGFGITRDGLVMLGERCATSKVDQMAVMDTGVERIDFHGEALCSISNVSLLEIVTKARGKPNGYRKIMKNSKCLFLGINDDRQEVGTTVVVRDIFYSQPVRKKQMESSPNKVLDSIKMRVLRVALVHVNVCYKVVDVDSADVLLCNGPLSSPLPLLCSHLGIGDSVSYHKVDISNGELKLSGFISDPCEKFCLKAIQYVYINSRFVCKGPIHKLVNHLAVRFNFSSSWLPAPSSPNRKQNKFDICPTFILNLCCPRSYYDMITSDQSKRTVEFKDWSPIITFIERGIGHLWAENLSHARCTHPRRSCAMESDMPDTSQRKRRNIKQNSEISLYLSSPCRKKLHRNYDDIPALEEYVSTIGKPSRSVPDLERHHTGAGFPSETDYQSQSRDRSLDDYKITMKNDIWSHLSRHSVYSVENVPYAYDAIGDGPLSSPLGSILLGFDDNVDCTSISSGVTASCVKFCDEVHVGKDNRKSLLKGCSFERSSSHDRLPARGELLEFGSDVGARIQKRWLQGDDEMLDEINQGDDGILDQIDQADCRGGLHYGKSTPIKPPSMTHYAMYEIPEFTDSLKKVRKGTSSQQSFRSAWSPMPTEKVLGIKLQYDDGDDPIHKTSVEDYSEFGTGSIVSCSPWKVEEDLKHSKLNTRDSCPQPKYSGMHFSCDNKRGISESCWGDAQNVSSRKTFKRFSETDWFLLPSYDEESPRNFPMQLSYESPPWKHESAKTSIRNEKVIFNEKKCSLRSHSAPPCYKGKKRYLDLTDSSTILSAKCDFWSSHAKLSSDEPSNSNHATAKRKCLQKLFGPCLLSQAKRTFTDGSFSQRQGLESMQAIIDHNGASGLRDQSINLNTGNSLGYVESRIFSGLDFKELDGSFGSGCKWRTSCPSTAGGNVPDYKAQDNILDISSDILDFSGDSLVPQSIGRMTLENAKVLNQVDKKFIPVVAGKNLAIIDQHAADERVRLEELRHKVLTGEMRTITYLDAEQELVLPEIGYQLLHNYSEQIQTWGWICNIHSQDTISFAKHLDDLHKQPTVVKLLAVPCILDVNLTDMDLLEFLQQLADTDGSSIIPPSVNRLLNNKACRGAIMFGDALLPSECSLIVEELKRTSLCFQCAHGRPTTVPLVNLDLLHHNITKHYSHEESWHGLRQHKLSLERTTWRLNSALRYMSNERNHCSSSLQ